MTADGSGNMPLFDYDKLKNNTDVASVASNVYEGLNFPFNESTFNGITTYSYDSFTDKNRVIDVDGDFKVDKYSNATVGNDKGVGFFPFDKTTATNNANKYGFGTEFDIDFYMSETGTLTAADGTQKTLHLTSLVTMTFGYMLMVYWFLTLVVLIRFHPVQSTSQQWKLFIRQQLIHQITLIAVLLSLRQTMNMLLTKIMLKPLA